MKMNNDPNWMREKAAQEDGCSVSVGSDLPTLRPDSPVELDKIADVCLNYRPKSRTKKAKRRKKRKVQKNV